MPFKSLLRIIFLVFIAATAGLYFYWNKPHRNIETETAITVSSVSLFEAYAKNETLANANYLDKSLLITGEVSDFKTNQNNKPVVSLKTNDLIFSVQCTFSDSTFKVVKGSVIKVKGLCTGLIGDVVLKDCMLLP